MKTTINKTVLTLTALMSVNTVFANSLPPTYENTIKTGIELASKKTKNDNKSTLANSLPPTPEKAMANSLPPCIEGKAMANSLPPCIEGKANPFAPSVITRQVIRVNDIRSQRVNMG